MSDPRPISEFYEPVEPVRSGPRPISEFFDEQPTPQGLVLRGAINSAPLTIEGLANIARQPDNSPIRAVAENLAERVAPFADEASPAGVGGRERLLERIGEQAVPAAVGAGLAGGIGGPAAALGEGALALSTPAVGEAVRSAGGDAGTAANAEMLYNVLAPSLAARAGSAAGVATPGLHRVSANRAARGMVPLDESGAGRFHDAAAARIEEMTEGVPRNESPTADMVLAEIAPNFEGLAIRKAQSDPGFQRRIGGRKQVIQALQDERIERAVGLDPERPVSALSDAAIQGERFAASEASALFDDLDASQVPAPLSRVRKALEDVESEATQSTRQNLPRSVARNVEALGEETSWRELQGLRQDVTEKIGSASKAGKHTRARWLRQVRDAIDDTFTDPSSPHAQTHPEAVRAWAEYRNTFDHKSKAYRALTGQGDRRKLVAEIMDGRNAIDELTRARDMLAMSPEALADFKTLVGRDTLMPEVGGASPRQIRARYRKRREAMAALWEPKEIRVFDEVVEEGISSSVGKAGRRAMNYGAGSSTLNLADARGGFLPGLARWVQNQAFGNDVLKSRVIESYLMNPTEMVPVLRAWRLGNAADVGRLVLAQSVKTAARAAANTAPGRGEEDGTTPSGGVR